MAASAPPLPPLKIIGEYEVEERGLKEKKVKAVVDRSSIKERLFPRSPVALPVASAPHFYPENLPEAANTTLRLLQV